MAYEWSPVSDVVEPSQSAYLDLFAVKPWGQTSEEAFQLTGRMQLSDMSGNRPPLEELGAVQKALAGAGWEQIRVTTVQEVTRTVIEREG
jgi:hypothetical protein